MNIQQTAAVVANIKLGDNRNVDELVISEWHQLIGDLDYEDCITAVRMHRKTSTDYLLPAHVRENARRIVVQRQRESRRHLAIEPNRITLDRERFEAETKAAIEAARAVKS